MKQKVFTLLTLLVLCVTGAWGADLIVTIDQIRALPTQAGLVKIDKTGTYADNTTLSGGKLSFGSSKTGTFTVYSTNTDIYKIKKIAFTTNRAPATFKCTDTDTDVSGSSTSWEYTPDTPVNNAAFTLTSTGSATSATLTVTLTTASTDIVEKLSPNFSLSEGVFSFTSSALTSQVELTDVGTNPTTISSSNMIQCGKSSSKTYGLNFKMKTGYKLKFISFYYYDASKVPGGNSGSITCGDVGTYTPNSFTWKAGVTPPSEVTFTINNGNDCNYTFYNIYVGYVADTPAGPTYDITYDPGSKGTGSIAAGVKSEDVTFTLSSNTFTRDGYVQTGWATSDGGAQVYALGGSYTTNADITLYPVWSKSNTYTAVFSYDSEHPNAAPAGWTFSNAGTYGANDATVAYEGAFGATFPGTGDCKNDNYIAFAKNASVYAKYDLGSAKTVTAVTGTFYVGSNNARTFTITYLGEDESVKHTITVNHPAESNWGEDDVNEVATVSNVRYIKINGMTSNQSWIVMSAFSVSTLYSEYVSVNTNTGRNYGTMVTPAGKKLDFAAVSDDVKAYISPGLNDGKDAISIQSVSVVPANTPIIIKTTAQGTTVSVPVTEEAADDVASINKLVAGDGTTDATPGTYTYYYIASDQFHRATSGTLTSGKAYLKLETATLARDIYGFDEGGETTAINKVEAKKVENGVYYNLAGQQVAQPTKGLYIVNGKKVVLK